MKYAILVFSILLPIYLLIKRFFKKKPKYYPYDRDNIVHKPWHSKLNN